MEKNKINFKKIFNVKASLQKKLEYFTYTFKKTSNPGEIYFSPKIHERIYAVPARKAISSCRTPKEKLPVILDFHLTQVMQNGKLYIKDPSDSVNKIRSIF